MFRQRWGKQPAPWHCWCQYPQTRRLVDQILSTRHWIEAFDLSKVEGLTLDTRCHLEKYEQKNEEKEKRKIENLNVRPILRWWNRWISCFRIDFCRMVSQWNNDQLSHHTTGYGYATRVRSSQCRLLYTLTNLQHHGRKPVENFCISWWKSKPVKFHKRSSSTEDFSPVPKLVINFSQLPNMSFVDEFHHFYTSFHYIFHRMVDNPLHRNLPCA